VAGCCRIFDELGEKTYGHNFYFEWKVHDR
jgi:hypothetical protein